MEVADADRLVEDIIEGDGAISTRIIGFLGRAKDDTS